MTLQLPELNVPEIRELYQLVKKDCELTRSAMEDTVKLIPSEPEHEHDNLTLHTQLLFLYQYCQTSYSILTCFALLMSAILQAYDPADEILALENDFYTEEIIQLAERMNKYRPLGATFVPVGLSAVFAMSDNDNKKRRALDLLLDYSTDFKGMRWMDSAEWFRSTFAEVRARLQARSCYDPCGRGPNPSEGGNASAWISNPPPNGSCFIQ